MITTNEGTPYMKALIEFFTEYEPVEMAAVVNGTTRYWTEWVAVGPDWMTIAGVVLWLVVFPYCIITTKRAP